MKARTVPTSMLFLLFLLISSGASITEEPPPEPIRQSQTQNVQENQTTFLSSLYDTQHDDVPIVNPTTPGTNGNPTGPGMNGNPTNPTVNPPPSTTEPSPTNPTVNPPPSTTEPSPTNPTVNPPPTTTEPSPTTPTTTTPAAPATNGNPSLGGGGDTTTPAAPATICNPPPRGGGAWCIASPSASETALQVALDYACGYGGADCSTIQSSGPCYNPNTVRNHASYAFNDYYQKNPVPTSCAFGGTAQLTNTDPSSGSCHYSSSKTTPTTPPTPTTPTTPRTPFPATPAAPTTYATEPGYGAEPIGEPSLAESTSVNLPLLLTACFMLLFAA